MSRQLHLAICVPSTDFWHARFGTSLVSLIGDLCASRIEGFELQGFRVMNRRGTILPQLRQELVEEALEWNASHVLFLDTDQTFPPTLVRRLLQHRYPVVACNIPTKQFPCVPTARGKGGPTGQVIITSPNREPNIERCWRIGTGVMLIETELFRWLPRPWFMNEYRAEEKKFMGEDWWFCRLLEENGIWPHLVHDVSWEIGHVGAVEFKHDFVLGAIAAGELPLDELMGAENPELLGTENKDCIELSQ